jgi:lysophospholipase L1-like esterase
VGSHCRGTNHQNIRGIERVVFLGDSVTVGTPPTASSDWYRNRLADALASEFGLSAPNSLWRTVNYVSGETLVRESGDFASCARYGARADDLMRDDSQVIDCIPEDERSKRTLIVMTMGGNDLNSIMQGFGEGKSEADLWTETETFIHDLRDTLAWLKTPGRFPNGVDVVLSNLYEYTDGTGKVTSCPAASLAGYKDIEDPALTEMVIWTMEQYVAMAADYDVDLMFLLEQFCGHGYLRDDPTSRCYRGPGSELWFDDTCIHPNSRGHLEIKDMVMSIVRE